MARTASAEAINDKIRKAQENVTRTKDKYSNAVAELEKLMEKKNEMKRAEIMDAIARSSRSYEEILVFLQTE